MFPERRGTTLSDTDGGAVHRSRTEDTKQMERRCVTISRPRSRHLHEA
jgi:hypothetical protein